MQLNSIARLLIAGLVCSLAGCATPSLFKMSKDDYPKAGPKNPVVRIVGMWQPSMGVGLKDKTCRGFSGQVFFFTQDSEIPAKVDGDVKFYVFDDQGTPDEQVKPVYEGNFEPDAWNRFLGKGSLGASYQIFVPYTRPGNHNANCTLRIRYTPRGGGAPVYSDMVEICLEGKKKSALDDAPHASDNADQRADGPAEAASRGRPQQPPYARGASQAVAFQQDAQPRQHGRAPELTEADRARMIREVQARLESETGDAISLVSHDEQSDQPSPVRSRPTSRRSRNPLADDDQPPMAQRESEQREDDELSDPEAPAAAGARSARQSAKHPLDDDDSLVPTNSPPIRSGQAPSANAPKKPAAHLLDEASARPAWSGDKDGAQTFTIQLSKSVFDGS
jgi:hypothetical protein